jgi:CO/xanthine dehydrogenase Mo-binding subunit
LEETLSGSLIHDPAQRPLAQLEWAQTNLMGKWDFGWGELVPAEQKSDFIVETIYKAPFVHHFVIEPHGAIAIPEGDRITVFSPVQHPFVARRVVSEMLGIEIEKVRIRSVSLGGSFGSKGYPKLEPVTALFAMLLKRPLKIVVTGDEEFFLAQREASQIHIRTGFSRSGDILFQDIQADFLVGAYTDISPRVIAKTAFHAAGPYRTPVARINARGLFTNTAPTTAFRGFGSPHIAMALEDQLNQAARILRHDPLSIRKQNIRARGEVIVPGETEVDGDWAEVLTKAAKGLGWDSPKPSGHGRGIAFGMKSCVPGTTSLARVRMLNDGDVLIEVGTTEMGQGATQAFSILVGNSLGISTDRIKVCTGDTDVAPYDAITASSRSAVHMGNALGKACDDIRKQLFNDAIIIGNLSGTKLSLNTGRIIGENGSISIQDLLVKRSERGLGEIIGVGCFSSEQDETHPLGGLTPFYEAVATSVELHIDRETGNIFIDRMVHVTDAGKLINPIRAIGQDDGGNVMGLGLALSEQLIYDRAGQLLNGNSLDYRIPTIEDVPRI